MSEIKALEELREKLERDTSKAKLYPTAPIKHAFAEGVTIEGYRALADAIEAEIAERFMELPLDADGVPIRIGDTVCEVDVRVPIEVMSLTFYEDCVDVNVCGMNPNMLRHVKPRTLDDVMAEYEELAANQNVKDYFEVSKELRTIQSEQFRDEPELELYKEVNGCRFYIELPYDELWIMTDKVEVKHHSYSYRYERPNGNTVMSCSSLCGYQREWAIERLDEAIEEIRELLGVGE